MQYVRKNIRGYRLTLRPKPAQSISCLVLPSIQMLHLITFEVTSDIINRLTVSCHELVFRIPSVGDLLSHQIRVTKAPDPVMTHKYRGSIIVLPISKSVEPNEEHKEMTSGFQ